MVGAAIEAWKKGLIHKKGMKRVADAARIDFEKIEFDSSTQKKEAYKQLEVDLQRVNEALGLLNFYIHMPDGLTKTIKFDSNSSPFSLIDSICKKEGTTIDQFDIFEGKPLSLGEKDTMNSVPSKSVILRRKVPKLPSDQSQAQVQDRPGAIPPRPSSRAPNQKPEVFVGIRKLEENLKLQQQQIEDEKAKLAIQMVEFNKMKEIFEKDKSQNKTLPDNQPGLSENVLKWTVEDVCAWIKSLNLTEDYENIIKQQGIDGDVLLNGLSDKTVCQEFGITKLGDVFKLTRAVVALKKE